MTIKAPIREPVGAGDIVHRLTAALGIPHCPACQRRKEKLNQALRIEPMHDDALQQAIARIRQLWSR
jgi:hypothetical protein